MGYHALFLRIIFCSVPLDFLGLENVFPLKQNAYFFSVFFAFSKRSSNAFPVRFLLSGTVIFSIPFAFPKRFLCIP